MSSRELQRVEVLGRVKSKALKQTQAAEVLRLSYRQLKRLWRRYQQCGPEGLKHGNAGRVSNRAKSARFRQRVLGLVAKKYGDFGPTLAAEHLAEEDGLTVDAETLRRWMLEAGLWRRRRSRRKHCQRRERKPHFGELVQLDGSFEAWFEERGPEGCLMHMVDDATSTSLARLGEQETIWAAAGVLRAWIRKYGVPRALYTDWKNVYKRRPTPAEELRGDAPQTQFGRMCAKLGIEIIAASSPQAKGRVERAHGTHQDRLIKKLRRQGIQDYAAANEYLEKVYLPEHNRRFARPSAEPGDYHRRAPSAAELRQVFRLETERRISNDWVVQHQGRWLQLQPRSRHYGPTRAKALVCEYEDGHLEVYYRGERIAHRELAGPPRGRSEPAPSMKSSQAEVAVPARRWKPGENHPWKQSYKAMPTPCPRSPAPAALVGVLPSASP
jgi:helix-turn-helix protein